MKTLIIIVVAALATTIAYGQSPTNEYIGKPCPDATLNILQNGKLRRSKISDFKGKYIVIDFWATWCVPCINALPRLNKLQKEFATDIQFLPMTNQDQKTISAFYASFNKADSLILPSAINEESLHAYFKHSFIPYTVILDREGKVVSIPNSDDITEANLRKLLGGEKPPMKQNADNGKASRYSFTNPLLTDNIFHTGHLYYSMIAGYNPLLPGLAGVKAYQDSSVGAKITVLNASISQLYEYAFGDFPSDDNMVIGISPARTRIESRDSDRLMRPMSKERNAWYEQNAYCYELIVPARLTSRAHKMMRTDLGNYFGYDAKIEKRKTMCWILKKLANAQIPESAGDTPNLDIDLYYTKMVNTGMSDFDFFMENKFLAWSHMPFIDETGINYKVDLNINAKMSNPESLKAGLNKAGLDLIKEERTVDMLIISDGKARQASQLSE